MELLDLNSSLEKLNSPEKNPFIDMGGYGREMARSQGSPPKLWPTSPVQAGGVSCWFFSTLSLRINSYVKEQNKQT